MFMNMTDINLTQVRQIPNYSDFSPFILSGSCSGQKQTQQHSNLPTRQQAATSSHCPAVGIEPLKLESIRFNNQEENYRVFKVRFNRLMKWVDRDLQVEYLIQCLKGESLRLAMMHIEDTAALDLIWKSLDKRYGNEAAAYQYHSRKLLALHSYPPCQTSADLKELYYVFKENTLALRRISKNSDAGEDFKSIFVGVLPEHLRRKVMKIMCERPEQYTLDHLLTLTGKEVQLNNLENITTSTQFQPRTSTCDTVSDQRNIEMASEVNAGICAQNPGDASFRN